MTRSAASRVALLLAFGLGLAACDAAGPGSEEGLGPLVAPRGFDFATAESVSITIAATDATGAPAPRAAFAVLDDAGRLILDGFTDPTGQFQLVMPVARQVETLTLRVDGLPDQTAAVQGGRAAFTFTAPAGGASLAPPATLAYAYYPGLNTFATVAFDDQWPGEGDYDFNDLVVDLNLVFGYDPAAPDLAYSLYTIDGTFRIVAAGASLRNGFGIEWDNYAPEEIVSTSGGSLTAGYVTQNANGTEAGQSSAVSIIFDDATALTGRPGGDFINTQPGVPYVTPPEVTVSLELDAVNLREDGYRIRFSPFAIAGGERGREIHQAGDTPTDLVDASLFGTAYDTSDPAQGRYYVTANNLPWALLLAGGFDYPIEKSPITTLRPLRPGEPEREGAYPFFRAWAESGGVEYLDWYTNPGLGYRNPQHIYTRP